ncbi:hypothetical protein [Asticcacaulis sp. 201]|uniref:hypothetical protein n=1 Tax=Asticcacaulis sp. 201 TaxID=3028787 RepID=UPI0029160489|nr:hypothetical protein [Asticcacaulis sp. 201]MDV6331237.1 hypothetical protein [Asticcacaulis sp. 201]
MTALVGNLFPSVDDHEKISNFWNALSAELYPDREWGRESMKMVGAALFLKAVLTGKSVCFVDRQIKCLKCAIYLNQPICTSLRMNLAQ